MFTASELIEQKLSEAQHRRNQVLGILNSTPDATRPNQPTSGFSGSGHYNNNNSSLFGSSGSVFEGDDRSLTNQYRTQRYQAPPPLCDVSALRVDDLITAFLRFRRSLHHLCYHGQSSRSALGDDNSNNHKSLAVHQLSEVTILQQRIDKVRFECFMMLEQLRDSAVNGAITVDTTDPSHSYHNYRQQQQIGNSGTSNTSSSIALLEAPEVARLKASIKEEKEKLREALKRLTIANYVPRN